MNQLAIALIGGVVGLAALLPGASAQVAGAPSACSQRPAVVEHLGQRFAEVPVAIGLQSNGSILEVFVSAKTGTWTIVVTAPTGVSCLITDGVGWDNLAPVIRDRAS